MVVIQPRSMTIDFRSLGFLLIVFSAILLILLSFVKIDVDAQSAFLCEQFSESNTDMQQCPVHTSNISWVILAAFGIAFFMLGLGIYMIFMSQSSEATKKEFKQIDLKKFSPDERKIYEALKNKDGSLYQSDLIRETGFSKAKVTRTLDRMEMKDIVERKRRGMANLIVLK